MQVLKYETDMIEIQKLADSTLPPLQEQPETSFQNLNDDTEVRISENTKMLLYHYDFRSSIGSDFNYEPPKKEFTCLIYSRKTATIFKAPIFILTILYLLKEKKTVSGLYGNLNMYFKKNIEDLNAKLVEALLFLLEHGLIEISPAARANHIISQ